MIMEEDTQSKDNINTVSQHIQDHIVGINSDDNPSIEETAMQIHLDVDRH